MIANRHLRHTLGIGEAGVDDELIRFRQTAAAAEADTVFDAYGGARYGYTGASRNLTWLAVVRSQLFGEGDDAFLQRNVTVRLWWLDPVMDVRMRHVSGDIDQFEIRSDVGGFGVGSNFSWQAYDGWSHDLRIMV